MFHSLQLRHAIGAASMIAVLFTFAVNNYEPPPFKFADRWHAVPPAYAGQLLAKPVRTLSYVLPVAQQAQAIPPLPEIDGFLQLPMPPVKPPIVSEERPPSPKPATRQESKGPDICRGKGRIITRGGKSWRCRR